RGGGGGLCHGDVVARVVSEGPERVRDLIALGVHFDGREDPEGWAYDLGQEGGHSQRRILHALDATGHEIIRGLSEAVRATPRVRILENHLAVDLLLDRSSEPPVCWGAYVLDRATSEGHPIIPPATFLSPAAPGTAHLYT